MPHPGLAPAAGSAPCVWLEGALDPAGNMARDAALLEAVARGTLAGPVFRLYTFAPAGITLGRGQDAARDLHQEALERAGIPWAVRPTGGGAIWHEEAWTVAVAGRLGPGGWAASPKRALARTGALLAAALRSLGVPAACRSGSGRPRREPGAGPPPCFGALAGDEVVVGERKLAGIAQRVRGRAFLQQANLLLGDAHARIARHVETSEPARARLEAELRARAVGAGRWLGGETRIERLAGALRAELGAGPIGEAEVSAGSPPAALAAPPRRSA